MNELLMCNIVEKLDEEAEATATANDDWHQLIGHSATAVWRRYSDGNIDAIESVQMDANPFESEELCPKIG